MVVLNAQVRVDPPSASKIPDGFRNAPIVIVPVQALGPVVLQDPLTIILLVPEILLTVYAAGTPIVAVGTDVPFPSGFVCECTGQFGCCSVF